MKSEILRMEHISKGSADIKILNDFKLNIYKGEILGLTGLSGTGKTTISNILSGLEKADEGKIYFNENMIQINERINQNNYGVFCIYHNMKLVPKLSVAENIFVIRKNSFTKIILNNKAIINQTILLLKEVDLTISPDTKSENLSIAEQHLVELAKAIVERANLIIIDDIIDSYTLREKKKFKEVIKKLKNKGMSFLIQSHKGEELFDIADRIVVLRDGRNIKTLYRGEYNKEKILSLLLGKDFIEQARNLNKKKEFQVLNVENLYSEKLLNNVSFKTYKGEILGILDMENKGNIEISDILMGKKKYSSGSIFLNGEKIQMNNIRQAIKNGIGFILKDSINNGIFLNMNISDNLVFLKYKNMSNRFLKLNKKVNKFLFREYKEELDINNEYKDINVKAIDIYTLQKIIFTKWIIKKPYLLIIINPYFMADIVTKEIVNSYLDKITINGTSVIIISSDLSEVSSICDRILVLSDGEKRGEYSSEDIPNLNITDLY